MGTDRIPQIHVPTPELRDEVRNAILETWPNLPAIRLNNINRLCKPYWYFREWADPPAMTESQEKLRNPRYVDIDPHDFIKALRGDINA